MTGSTMAPPPRGKTGAMAPIVLPGLMMIAVVYGLARFSYGLFLPQFRLAFDLGETLLGLIAGGSYLGYCIAIMIASALAPRTGPRAVIVLAGAVATLGLGLVAAATSGPMLAAGVLIAGTSTGLASPPMGDAVSAKIPETKQGAANSWINAGTSIGVIISAPIALSAAGDWRLAWAAFAAVALATMLWNAAAMPGRAASPWTNRSPAQSPRRPRILDRHSLPLIVSAFSMGFASAVYWTFSRDLLIAAGDMSSHASMLFWTVIGVAGIAGGLAGRLCQQHGLSPVLRTSLASFGLSIAALPLMPGLPAYAFASAAVFGAGYIMLTGIYLVWSVAVFKNQPSLGIGLSFMMIAVGQTAGSPVAGVLASNLSMTAAFYILGLAGVIGALVGPHSRERSYFQQLRAAAAAAP